MEKIEWEPWNILPGASLPKTECIDNLIPGYSKLYTPANVNNYESYIHTMKDRFEQRCNFIENAHHAEGADIFIDLHKALKPNLPDMDYSDIDGAPGMSPPRYGRDTEAE